MWRLPVWIILWALVLCIKLLTFVVGLGVVRRLYRYRFEDYGDLPGWTQPWSNIEDWKGQVHHYFLDGVATSLPKWWVDKHGAELKRWYQYHAIKNGGNGLRAIKWINLKIDSEKVRYWGSKPGNSKSDDYQEPKAGDSDDEYFTFYTPEAARKAGRRAIGYIAWQGWQAGVKIVVIWSGSRHLTFKFGWDVAPVDRWANVGFQILRDNRGFATKLLPAGRG